MKNNFRTIIGRDLSLTFVQGVPHEIAARIDTGAYRSALHADRIKLNDGTLSFRVLGGHPVFGSLAFEMTTANYSIVTVENSFGQTQERYEVPLKIKIAGKIFTARFSLADRSKKKYPILVGRTLLSKRFIVDTSISNLDRNHLKKLGIAMPRDEEMENS